MLIDLQWIKDKQYSCKHNVKINRLEVMEVSCYHVENFIFDSCWSSFNSFKF